MTLSIAGNMDSATLPYGAARPAPAALQAQLQRYQQQLSDCVNCASADTAQGKSDIEAIAGRIALVRQRIAQLDGAEKAALAPAPGAAPAGRIDVFV